MSNFKLYCIGTVAESKSDISTPIIQVTLDEIHPLEDGDKISSQEKYTAFGEDRKGTPYRAEVSVDKTVDATWIRTGNRVSAPDVVRGEKVSIYRYDNDDKFYWSETGIGKTFNRRKKETVIHAVSAVASDNEKTECNSENCYTAVMSGHGQKIVIDMPIASDEKAAMRATFDGTTGVIEIKMMGVGVFTINHERVITAALEGGASMELNKGDITLKFDNLNLEGNNANFKINSTDWKGNLDHKGNIESVGTINNTGKIISNTVSVDMHKHPGNNQPPTPGS